VTIVDSDSAKTQDGDEHPRHPQSCMFNRWWYANTQIMRYKTSVRRAGRSKATESDGRHLKHAKTVVSKTTHGHCILQTTMLLSCWVMTTTLKQHQPKAKSSVQYIKHFVHETGEQRVISSGNYGHR